MGQHERYDQRPNFGAPPAEHYQEVDHGGGHQGGGAAPRRRPRVIWAVVAVALLVWSLIGWSLYSMVDPTRAWVASTAKRLANSGQSLATAAGVEQRLGSAVSEVGGLIAQGTDLLHIPLKSLIVLGWALGAVLILIAPFILRKLKAVLARRPAY